MDHGSIAARTERTEWFREARFGMFIHWGLYAIPARGEWVRSIEQMPAEEYAPFFDEFTAEHFNPREWARLAKRVGMRYAVLTAKHHDGFCLFDTRYTDFKSTKAPCGRDLVAEYLEAFRAEGIQVGLYYSVIDWRHPDYPHYGDKIHPMREQEECANDGRNFDNYIEYMHGQVRELLTNYGHLDIMWFDFSYEGMNRETWKATELMEMVRELQPHILIDNRLEGSGEDFGSILTRTPTIYAGDFASPEQVIPPKGIVNEDGDPVPWEACVTLNNNWGYVSSDRHYKSAKLIIRTLVECVSKDGNLLLNVGPDATGRIPRESVRILEEVGEWMAENSASIYGCGCAGLHKPEWGRLTCGGGKLYAHVMEEQVGAICLEGMANRVQRLRLLRDGSEIRQSFYWNLQEYPDNAFFFFNPNTADNYPLPDERDSVVEITLREDA